MSTHLRQLGICDPADLNTALPSTTIVGLGGIGSSATLALYKMGLKNINAYDPDTLEEHNVGNQFLPAWTASRGSSLGKPKGQAALDLFSDMMGPDAMGTACFWNRRFDGQEPHPFGYLTVITVDTMKTRKELWDAAQDSLCRWYIDGRMGAQTLRIYVIDRLSGADILHYENSLYSDDEALDEPCTARGIVFTSMFAGAHIANIVKQIAVGPQQPPRELIHMIEHNQVMTIGRD